MEPISVPAVDSQRRDSAAMLQCPLLAVVEQNTAENPVPTNAASKVMKGHTEAGTEGLHVTDGNTLLH